MLKNKTTNKKDSKIFSQGLSEELVKQISKEKDEPKWMLDKRLDSLAQFYKIALPEWGPSLDELDLEKIVYYLKGSNEVENNSWENVPEYIKDTFKKLGVHKAEEKFLAGSGVQYESEGIYHNLKKEWDKLGVIFEDLDVAVKKYPEIVKKYFMTCVPNTDHKFSALHGAVWSGGSFLFIPKGVKIDLPFQAYFRMNMQRFGQFEHTLIIVEDDAQVHYIEGCSAPRYGSVSLHAGCVEIFVGKNARMRYSSVENWSRDVYNLNTKRAILEENAHIEWVSGNLGSQVTMLYPCSVLKGNNSRADHFGIAVASKGQIQDTGAKIIHIGKQTSSNIVMKGISKDGGKTIYRGLVKVGKKATGSKVSVKCDSLIADMISSSDAYPKLDIGNSSSTIVHEASAGEIDKDKIFYLNSRGIPREEAISLIVNGFFENIVKELPLEYAVEFNRLISMEFES